MKLVRSTRAVLVLQLLNRRFMKLKDFKGFMVGGLVVASGLSVLAVVQIPNVFKPGDLITADGMNQNFSSLKAGIDAVEIAANSKQSRVSGVCAAGSSIRVVNADGTVTCQLDNGGAGGSSYTAGTGLKLAGSQFSVDNATVQSRVAGVCAAGSAIKEVKTDGQVVCETVGNTGGGVAGVSAVNGKTGGVSLESGSANLTVDNSQTGKVIFSVANTGGSSYTAGLGLTLTGTQFLVDTAVIQARVTGVCDSGTALAGINLDGTVNCNAVVGFGGSLTGTTSALTGFSIANYGDGNALDAFTYSNTGGFAIKGKSYGTTGLSLGVYGDATDSPTGTGVVGKGGVTGGYFEAVGEPSGGFIPTGLYGFAKSNQGVGVKAQGSTALEVNGNIKVSGSAPAAFRVTNPIPNDPVASNTPIDNPITNNDPNAIILITGINGAQFSTTLFYVQNKWSIGCNILVSGARCPTEFNVLVIKR
jgi:competence protein ComGC